tara:strand:+ start:332 stop:589 length:258 start_codon:yes stop_codon:yes gene_type:complete
MSFIAEELAELIEYTIKEDGIFEDVEEYEYTSDMNMTEDQLKIFQCGYIQGLRTAILKLQDHYPSDLSESITEFWDDEEMYGAND